jgi:hypothetical protein
MILITGCFIINNNKNANMKVCIIAMKKLAGTCLHEHTYTQNACPRIFAQ